ncbi:MAG: hypothetical protein ACLFTT_02975 [Candidatus Hydrogenedentota bacterium]
MFRTKTHIGRLTSVLLIALASLAVPIAAYAADELAISAAMRPARAPFHRPATYTVHVEAPATMDIALPAIEQDDLVRIGAMAPAQPEAENEAAPVPPPLPEVRAHDQQEEALDGGRVRYTRTYTVDPIAPGMYLVPPFQIAYGPEQQQRATVPAMLHHARPLTEAEEQDLANFRDIGAPWPFLPAKRSALLLQGLLIGLALVVVAAALGGIVYYSYKKAAAPGPPQPPWEVARQRLQALAARKLPEQGRYETYYVDLSAILRYYLEDRFAIHAPEQTTQEFIESASEGTLFTQEQQGELGRFMRHCDRVKFARYEPTPAEMARSFERVSRFIEETVPTQTDPDLSPDREAAA